MPSSALRFAVYRPFSTIEFESAYDYDAVVLHHTFDELLQAIAVLRPGRRIIHVGPCVGGRCTVVLAEAQSVAPAVAPFRPRQHSVVRAG